MAELAFLDAVTTYLAATPLSPVVAASRIGVTDPFAAGDLPSVVLSLDATERRRVGLGDRGELMHGALPVATSIDLANPVLATDPTFTLLSADRRSLVMPHGGQVRADGSEGALANVDLIVRLGASTFTVVPGAPQAGDVRADALTGTLVFGDALPNAGTLQLQYFLGEWERRTERIVGTLRVDCCAASAADAQALGASVVRRLQGPEARDDIQLLLSISLTSLGVAAHRPPIANVAPAQQAVAHFRRAATFAFEYQHLIDRADSSGGVIRRIPVRTRLEAITTDRATGAIVRDVITVPG
ncbi:MAG: hypothetical protein IT359_03840 [Gemmatimonadaceae bacterium]|nr:hypothetical protein [Gemmatimonadaceae bacterium]